MKKSSKVLCGIAATLIITGTATAWYYSQMQQSINILKMQAQQDHLVFDDAMYKNQFEEKLALAQNQQIYNAFKGLYEKFDLTQVTPQKNPKIPKIIHIMWLGSKLPAEYESYVASWRTYHPDWIIIFWTDNVLNYSQGEKLVTTFEGVDQEIKRGTKCIVAEIKQLNFPNRPFYNKACNYGERSDILKWEVVERFGGVYVDTDFECLRSLDLFHHCYDFYTGIQPLDTAYVQLGAALFGAYPHHPVMQACVQNIKNNQHIPQIVAKTGPLHFTRCFLEYAGRGENKDIAFPAQYFYPCSYEQRAMPSNVWCTAQSYAVHHWAASWIKPEAFVRA